MTFMDLLFHEYASPFLLLDGVISSGRFVEFIETFEKQREERSRWEYYIHKIPPWNDITWDEFNGQIDNQSVQADITMTEEQLETTIKNSYNVMKNFKMSEERG